MTGPRYDDKEAAWDLDGYLDGLNNPMADYESHVRGVCGTPEMQARTVEPDERLLDSLRRVGCLGHGGRGGCSEKGNITCDVFGADDELASVGAPAG